VLYLVLVLVIAAFGLLIAALTTANTVWAWVSVAISVFAAGLLVFDWLRGRRRVAATSAPREPEPLPATPPQAFPDEPPAASTTEIPPVVEPPADDEQPVAEVPAEANDQEPDEEATDAADLLVVSDLGVEVVVVDEHPRYHLSSCGWLADKKTIPIPVSEARELGFTPCARCGPDAILAARRRSTKGAAQ
jgi:hypothetical protein